MKILGWQKTEKDLFKSPLRKRIKMNFRFILPSSPLGRFSTTIGACRTISWARPS